VEQVGEDSRLVEEPSALLRAVAVHVNGHELGNRVYALD
jgi:hypothetical protein